jgi:hypothetical protein
VEEPPGLVPAGLSIEGAGRAVPSGGGEVHAGVLAAPGSAHEVPGRALAGGARGGHPGVQVALSAGGQGEAACGQPVQERDGGGDVVPGGVCLVVGGRVPRSRCRSRRSTCQAA